MKYHGSMSAETCVENGFNYNGSCAYVGDRLKDDAILSSEECLAILLHRDLCSAVDRRQSYGHDTRGC